MISLNSPSSSAALVAMLVITATGCSQTSSENVTTQGVYADIRVIALGLGSTVVKAQLLVGNGGPGSTMINLAPGDTLTATANGIQKPMVQDMSLVGEIEYYAGFDFDDANTEFTVSFSRNNGVNAPNSNVVLPEGFVIMLPDSATIFSRGETVDVVWAPSGTSIVPAISVTVECVLAPGIFVTKSQGLSVSVDDGTASIPVDAIIPDEPIDDGQLCDATLYLSRQRYGNLDPNYGEGGLISAEHHQRGTFFVDPATP